MDNDIFQLEGKDAELFIEYITRKRTEKEVAKYEESDQFYNHCCTGD